MKSKLSDTNTLSENNKIILKFVQSLSKYLDSYGVKNTVEVRKENVNRVHLVHLPVGNELTDVTVISIDDASGWREGDVKVMFYPKKGTSSLIIDTVYSDGRWISQHVHNYAYDFNNMQHFIKNFRRNFGSALVEVEFDFQNLK